MNMRFVDVGADHKGMIAFGEPPGKFYAQPVGFLRCDLSGPERLAHMVGDHIICTPHSSGGGNILPLEKSASPCCACCGAGRRWCAPGHRQELYAQMVSEPLSGPPHAVPP